MTYNNESIKQEPCSPPSDMISPQLLAGSTMYRQGLMHTPAAYTPSPHVYHPYFSAAASGQYSSGSDSQAASPSPKATLKKTILSRRKANGQDELGPLFEDPKHYELTQADLERRERRREQNRRAAKRCRNKKKNLQSQVSQETEALMQQNRQLAAENAQLEQELTYLRHVIDDHIRSGCCIMPRMTAPYENQRPATAHIETEVSNAISGAHFTLNTDPIATKGADAPCTNAIPNHSSFESTSNVSSAPEPVKNLDSFNLSSLDISNLVSDLVQSGMMYNTNNILENSQQPHFLHTAQHSELSSIEHCVDPNLIQQNVVSNKPLPQTSSQLSESPSASLRLGEQRQTTHTTVCQNEYGNPLVQQRLCNMDQYQGSYYGCNVYVEQNAELQYYSSSQN